MDVNPLDQGQEIILHSRLHLLAVTILYWDHLITLGDEIRCIWRHPKNFSVCVFIANRYLAAFGDAAVTCINFTTLSETVCNQFMLFRQCLLVANQVLVCLLLTLRTYALFGRDRRILAFMITSAACLIAASAWALTGQKNNVSDAGPGCHVAISKITGIHLAVPWESLFVYDMLVFGLTLRKTLRSGNFRRLRSGSRLPLTLLLLRDGAFYFGVMALANLANILTFYKASPLLRGSLSTFAGSISVTLVSRLMLNLHDAAESTTTTRTGLSTTAVDAYTTNAPVFTSRIDAMELSVAEPFESFSHVYFASQEDIYDDDLPANDALSSGSDTTRTRQLDGRSSRSRWWRNSGTHSA